MSDALHIDDQCYNKILRLPGRIVYIRERKTIGHT